MLGNGRVEAMCFDGEKRLAHIRGKMRKKVSQSYLIQQWLGSRYGAVGLSKRRTAVTLTCCRRGRKCCEKRGGENSDNGMCWYEKEARIARFQRTYQLAILFSNCTQHIPQHISGAPVPERFHMSRNKLSVTYSDRLLLLSPHFRCGLIKGTSSYSLYGISKTIRLT